jgi:hypothetical protein
MYIIATHYTTYTSILQQTHKYFIIKHLAEISLI